MVRCRFEMSNAFKRDLKKYYLSLVSMEWVLIFECLLKGYEIPEKYKDHPLQGDWVGFRDCHIKPDLVLIYKIVGDTVELHRLNSHSKLFD